MEDNNHLKCFNCGKNFKCLADLNRHKSRKTPCLIREISAEDINNPNRCIYCNKILSKLSNLKTHLKTCKIKNGGIDILDDKVRHEQELRIVKEEKDRELKTVKDENERDKAEYEKKIQYLMDKVSEIEKRLSDRKEIVEVNNNNVTVNGDVNITHIHVTDWANPSIQNIKLTVDQLTSTKNMQQMFFMTIYMNPNEPENHSIIPRNRKEKSVLFHKEGAWATHTGDEMMEMLDKAAYISMAKGGELIYRRNGIVPNGDMKIYRSLPLSLQEYIDSGVLKEKLTSEQVYNLLFDNKDRLCYDPKNLPKTY